MRDVARAAGVSPALVSIVFRETAGASPRTREKVFATARSLGYVRDERARGLRSLQRDSIGITFRLDQPFQAAVVAGVYDAVNLAAHPIVTSPTSETRDEEEALSDLIANRCGAVIVLSSRLPADRLARIADDLPVVSIARTVDAPRVDWVASDERGGIRLAVDHLVELGHRDIVYLSDTGSAGGPERLEGFHDAVLAAGIRDSARAVGAGRTEDAGSAATLRLLDAGRLPTAIVGFNDRCALGVIDTLIRRGVRVPDEVSVVGFDDSEVAARSMIRMTSVRQDPIALARAAAERVMLRVGPGGGDLPAAGIVKPTSLTVRSTTAPPRVR